MQNQYEHFWKFHNKDNMDKHAIGFIEWQNKRIKKLEALRDTVSMSCNPPKDCNDPEVLKVYMKACFDKSQKLY